MSEWEIIDRFSGLMLGGALRALDWVLLDSKKPCLRFISGGSAQAILTSVTSLRRDTGSAAIKIVFHDDAISKNASGVFLSTALAGPRIEALVMLLERILHPGRLEWIGIPRIGKDRKQPSAFRVPGKILPLAGHISIRDEHRSVVFAIYGGRYCSKRKPEPVQEKISEPAENLSGRSRWFQRRFGPR
jgi:hypothetical protein